MWTLLLTLVSPAGAFETKQAVVHSEDGFCARADLSVTDGQVTVACERIVASRHRLSVKRPTAHSRLLALEVPMVVAVPARDREALDAALRENGIATVSSRP